MINGRKGVAEIFGKFLLNHFAIVHAQVFHPEDHVHHAAVRSIKTGLRLKLLNLPEDYFRLINVSAAIEIAKGKLGLHGEIASAFSHSG